MTGWFRRLLVRLRDKNGMVLRSEFNELVQQFARLAETAHKVVDQRNALRAELELERMRSSLLEHALKEARGEVEPPECLN